MGSPYPAVNAAPKQIIETKLNTTYIDIAVFVFSVFPLSNFNDVLFYILAINCIKLIFGCLYFSGKTFPKI